MLWRLVRAWQVCLVLALCALVLSLYMTSFHWRLASLAFRAVWGPPVDWYDFSQPSLFLFYVYSAFLVDDGPRQRTVVRLVSISSPLELLARYELDVFCVVRMQTDNSSEQQQQHVASLLLSPLPRPISELGTIAWYDVADYVYTCPLPARYRPHRLLPVRATSIIASAHRPLSAP